MLPRFSFLCAQRRISGVSKVCATKNVAQKSMSVDVRSQTKPSSQVQSDASVAVENFELNVGAAETHVVFNQSRPFEDVDYYASDKPLSTLMDSLLIGDDKQAYQSQLASYGKTIGSADMMHTAREANLHKPQLSQFDLQGNRIDKTLYTPSYHKLMEHGISHHITNYGYQPAYTASTNTYDGKGRNESVQRSGYNQHLVRAGYMYFQNQLEPGHCCPLVMTSAAIPVFLKASLSPSDNNGNNGGNGAGSNYFATTWLPKLLSNIYDGRDVPIDAKEGVTIGMSMTEKQGGSDVRANTTIATLLRGSASAGSGAFYTLRGHKWFTSAPMSDGFLTLAKVDDSNDSSLTCFLVPRYRPDGSKNTGFKIMRLKNKMGDHSNGSSEVEYHDAFGIQIGEKDKGIQTILQMVQMTRLDCTLASGSGSKKALLCALNHAVSRSTFGNQLIRQPLMENLLTDLCITQQGTMLAGIRLAQAHATITSGITHFGDHGHSNHDDHGNTGELGGVGAEGHVFRVGVAIMKYYTTKLQPQLVYECMEVLGGNGYTEDYPLAQLFRHSPLNSIWEGSGNIMALDVLRAHKSIPYFIREMHAANNGHCRPLTAYLRALSHDIHTLSVSAAQSPEGALVMQRHARNLVDRLAVGFIASLYVQYSPLSAQYSAAADAWISSRIYRSDSNASNGLNYGSTAVYEPEQARVILEGHLPQFH